MDGEYRLRVAYFVHDLTDPAVGKRVRMLRAAGAEVVLLGFRREDGAVAEITGVRTVDLGRTFDSNFRQRIAMVLRRFFRAASWAHEMRDADVLLARNLEMLALAVSTQRKYARRARIVYECLDIHRLLLSDRIGGKCLRAIERTLLRRVNLLVVSSPAFVSEYFEPKQDMNRGWRMPVYLLENKVPRWWPVDAVDETHPRRDLRGGPPWRIGWFGMIRCHKSLDILCDLAARRPDLVEVTIRGRPSQVEFENFDAQVDRTKGVRFGGAYLPAELESLYRNVHFNWAIDYFEEGANSNWLLPNRIYEGGLHDAVPIALGRTETGRWLKRLGLGILLESTGAELETFLSDLTPARYAELKRASCAAPRGAFVADDGDFTSFLRALIRTTPVHAEASATSPSIEFDLADAGEPRDDAALQGRAR